MVPDYEGKVKKAAAFAYFPMAFLVVALAVALPTIGVRELWGAQGVALLTFFGMVLTPSAWVLRKVRGDVREGPLTDSFLVKGVNYQRGSFLLTVASRQGERGYLVCPVEDCVLAGVTAEDLAARMAQDAAMIFLTPHLPREEMIRWRTLLGRTATITYARRIRRAFLVELVPRGDA